jgi:hypothetical protein
MPDVEIRRKLRLPRDEVGQRLIALGTALSAGSEAHLDFDGDSIFRFGITQQMLQQIALAAP